MNVGLIQEAETSERRVALTPCVVRQLAEHGSTGWVEKGAGGVKCVDPASEESLRDEGRQVEGRKRRSVYVWRIKPAGHEVSITCHGSGVKFLIELG